MLNNFKDKIINFLKFKFNIFIPFRYIIFEFRIIEEVKFFII